MSVSTPPPVEEKKPAEPSVEDEPAPSAKHEMLVAAEPKRADDLEEDFFSDARIHTPQAFAVSEEIEVEPPKPSPKMTPVARARRKHFSKYVKGAMVAATAILALAGIRVATGRADRGPDAYKTTAALAAAPRPAEPEAPQVAPVAQAEPMAPAKAELPKEEPKVETPPAAEAKVEAPKEPAKEPAAEPAKPEPAKPEAAKAEPAKAEPTAAEPAKAAAPGDKTALQEKVEARKLLERGKAAGAIEAGERSVALDPSDGETWLLLGAAYQEKGNLPKARAAFQSCLKEAKRGPKAECKAMLQ